jgi:hypothetical protein
LQVLAGGTVKITDDADVVTAILDAARPQTALYVGGMGARGKNFYNDIFVRYGYEVEASRIQDAYLDGRRLEAEAAIPDDFLQYSNLIGDEAFIRERVEAFRAAGVTYLQATPVGSDPLGDVDRLRKLID